MVEIAFDYNSVESYRQFLSVRECPVYSFRGTCAVVPDEYAGQFGSKVRKRRCSYASHVGLFDYQRDIARLAIEKRKYAIFADCGLGKTLMLLEFARAAAATERKPVLIVAPLMVCDQTINEHDRWYPSADPIVRLRASTLQAFLSDGSGVGIVNYEAIREDLRPGRAWWFGA